MENRRRAPHPGPCCSREEMTGGGGGDKHAWKRLATGSARRKVRYGRNWRQRADAGRRASRDDGHEVA
jgi:hypothetical protein